jgi:hypothetical protein
VEEEAGAVDGGLEQPAALLGQMDSTRSSAGRPNEQAERADAAGDGRLLLAAPAGRPRGSPEIRRIKMRPLTPPIGCATVEPSPISCATAVSPLLAPELPTAMMMRRLAGLLPSPSPGGASR